MFKSVLKFARIRILVTCYALVFLGSVAAGSISTKTVLALFVLAAWYIHAASTNDYADREIDKINLKTANDRPLVSRDISQKQFWIIHFSSGILSLVFASFYGAFAVLATVGMLVTDYLYSIKPFRISDRGIYSQLVLAVGYVFYPFSLGYWAIMEPSGYSWLLATGLYLGFVARILLKDFRDVKGDKKHGKMTFLLRHGARITCKVSGLFWLLALIAMGSAVSFKLGALIPLVLGFLIVLVLLSELAAAVTINDQQQYIALIAKAANVSVIVILTLLLCEEQAGLANHEITFIPLIIGVLLLFLTFVRYKTLDISSPTSKI